ncbi:hypothetical protein Tco_0630243 [Tanacetum coccineum]
MTNTQPPFHPDQSSLITYLQHPQPNNNFVLQPSFNASYMQQPMQNPKDISDPTTAIDMALVLIAKAFTLNDITLTNNNQRSSSNPRNMQIAQPGVQNDGNQIGLSIDPGIANEYGIRNVIAQKEEAGIQLTQEEFYFMADASSYEEIERVNANCTLKDNLQQASTSSTQTDKAPVYDSDGSAENDSNVIYEVSSVEQDGETIEQHPAIVEETRVFVSQMAKSREELYFSNTFKTANVSKSISIPNEEFSDDTTPSVVQKFLDEIKSTIVTLQRVVKQKMTLDIHNWSYSVHQEIHKIVKDEIFPIINQVDARVQNFEIQFLKEAATFVRDFKSLTKETDESLAKHKALELEIERLLRAVVSQDIMSIVQSNSVIDTSNLQTELERIKE